jgi:hypothetical protein
MNDSEEPSEALEGTTVGQNGEEGTPHPMSLLPLELRRNIFSFLNSTDAIALSISPHFPNDVVVCQLRPDLPFDLSSSAQPNNANGRLRFEDEPIWSLRVPMVANLDQCIVHSVTVSMNLVHRIYDSHDGLSMRIVSVPRYGEGQDPVPFRRLTFDNTHLVPNRWWETISFTFFPQHGNVYYLALKHPGVCLQDCVVTSCVYDDGDRTFSKAFLSSYELGLIPRSNQRLAPPLVFPHFEEEYKLAIDHVDSLQLHAARDQDAAAYFNLLLRVMQNQLTNTGGDFASGDRTVLGLPITASTLGAVVSILRTFLEELDYDWRNYAFRCHEFDVYRENWEAVEEFVDDGEESDEESNVDSGEDESGDDENENLDFCGVYIEHTERTVTLQTYAETKDAAKAIFRARIYALDREAFFHGALESDEDDEEVYC